MESWGWESSITCLSLSCLSLPPSIKPFSQQSYAMQASGPTPITGGCSFSPLLRWKTPVMPPRTGRLGSPYTVCTKLRKMTSVCNVLTSSGCVPFKQHICTLTVLQVMKAQQDCPCLPAPPLGKAEVLPAPSSGCWSFPPSWSNLRTRRLWVQLPSSVCGLMESVSGKKWLK